MQYECNIHPKGWTKPYKVFHTECHKPRAKFWPLIKAEGPFLLWPSILGLHFGHAFGVNSSILILGYDGVRMCHKSKFQVAVMDLVAKCHNKKLQKM